MAIYACTCYHPLLVFNQFGDLERCALRAGNVHSADGWDDVLKSVVARYQGKVSRIYFRADAAFAMPEVYEFLEAERIKYAIRLPANQVLQSRIGYLLTRPVGRPPHHVRRFHANFGYQAGTWTKPRRVIAKVEWHPGELYPRVGFIVTNMSRGAERVVAFYNKRGTCEQWIKEGKGASGPAAAATTSASVRRSMVMHSRVADGRSASQMPRKTARSGSQAPLGRSGMSGAIHPLASGLPACSENAYHPRQFRVLLGNPGLNRNVILVPARKDALDKAGYTR